MTAQTVPSGTGRRRVIIAICVAVLIAAVVTVVVVLATRTSDTSAPDSPSAAATAWGRAALFHDKATLRALSCSSSSAGGFGIYDLVFNGSGVRAGAATAQGHDSWDVPVTTTGPGGGTTVHVGVKKRGGKYLVC